MAEPWDSLRLLFPDNTEGLITAANMRTQVDTLESVDAENVKTAELETELVTPLTNLDTTFWKGNWDSSTTYEKGQMVLDSGWLMVANQTTDERPAPQPTGDPAYVYGGVGLVDTSVTAKQVTVGTRYKSTGAFYVNGYRINTVAGNRYDVILVTDPLGVAQPEYLSSFVANDAGWREFGVTPQLIPPNTEFDIRCIIQEPDPAPTIVTYPWNYLTPGSGVPLSGQAVHQNNFTDRILFHYLDQNGVDRSAFLQGLVPGDLIDSQGVSWSVQSITDVPASSYVTVFVAPAVQGTVDGVQDFQFTVPTPASITYGLDSDEWLGNANIRGLYVVDDSWENVVPDDNQYGVDLLTQAVTASDHWDAMAVSESGAGQTTFTPSYDYDKTIAFTVPSTTYSEVSRLTTIDRAGGTYEVKMSWTSSLDSAVNSQFFRFSTDGGATWQEFVIEPSDTTNVYPFVYFYPFEHEGGTLEIIFQARKELAGDVMTIDYLDLIFERVR